MSDGALPSMLMQGLYMQEISETVFQASFIRTIPHGFRPKTPLGQKDGPDRNSRKPKKFQQGMDGLGDLVLGATQTSPFKTAAAGAPFCAER